MKFIKCVKTFCVGVGSEVLRQTREVSGSIPCRVLRNFSTCLSFLSAFTTAGLYSLVNINGYQGISLKAEYGRRVELKAMTS